MISSLYSASHIYIFLYIIDFIRILGQYYGSSQHQTRASPRSSKRISFSNILKRGSSPSDNSRRIQNSKYTTMQQSSITRGTDKFVDLLHVMSQQLDGLRAQFFKALETACIVYIYFITIYQYFRPLPPLVSQEQQTL